METARYSLIPATPFPIGERGPYLTLTSDDKATTDGTLIEIRVDWPGLLASGLSAMQARLQINAVLKQLVGAFIGADDEDSLPG